jgi:hypothetical protein
MAKCSVCESEEFDTDLDDFSTEEIIDHLEWEADNLTSFELKKLKKIVKDTDECFADQVLGENYLYQQIESLTSAIDRWKLDIILKNLDKYTYAEICEMFENK